jgi:hypothetical protein
MFFHVITFIKGCHYDLNILNFPIVIDFQVIKWHCCLFGDIKEALVEKFTYTIHYNENLMINRLFLEIRKEILKKKLEYIIS